MGDLKNEDTSYPATLDTRTLIADSTDDVVAAHINGLASAIIALETELGINPAGSVADLVTRLAVNIHDDGGVLRGTSFPVSPPLKLHLFWRTDLKQLYMYDTSIAQYQRVDATNVHASLASLDADDHTQYVHNTTARTITAQHTFNPGSALPPFILHANAQGQKVIGLDAETVDGKNPGSASGLATLNGSSLVVEDPANATATKTAGKICKWGTSEAFECSALTATTISGTTVTATTQVTTDTIAERTGAAGVTIDSCLIKDGGAAAVADGTNIIKTKVIAIGDWNMDATASVSVTHGLDASKIVDVSAIIIPDTGTGLVTLHLNYATTASGLVNGNIVWLGTGTIVGLERLASSIFDSVNYDATSYNRGYVTITYIV